jgi:hypothetical protein
VAITSKPTARRPGSCWLSLRSYTFVDYKREIIDGAVGVLSSIFKLPGAALTISSLQAPALFGWRPSLEVFAEELTLSHAAIL